ncbi:addiction module protein [Aquisphaera insulae]|uniref:addiction module protein n=1 Tax=Aquisphaera insulae TaxID=2712864 RepID=UPI0021108430|nr:addiction module protein [Aquisphaera insulae]
MDYQVVLHEVESWPIDDRVRLVQDLWDRLADQGHEPDLTVEMKAELERRIEELDRNPDAGIPWEQAKSKSLERIRP